MGHLLVASFWLFEKVVLLDGWRMFSCSLASDVSALLKMGQVIL